MQLSDKKIRAAIKKLDDSEVQTGGNAYWYMHPWSAFIVWMCINEPKIIERAENIKSGVGLHDKRTKAYKMLIPYYKKHFKDFYGVNLTNSSI